MVAQTHKKYTNTGWEHNSEHPYEHSFIPDTIIDSIITVISPYLTFADQIKHFPWDLPSTLQSEFTIDDAIVEVDHLLNGLSPLFKDAVKNAQNSNKLIIKPAENQNAQGHCSFNGTVFWHYDNTINNPIYLAHEFGHHLGFQKSAEKTPWNITEWQSFFVQHAQYDKMSEQHPNMLKAIKEHRNFELLLGIKNYATDLKDSKNKQRIHYHSSAMFIGLALYQKYKLTTDETTRKEMIEALYFNGEQTTPESVLESFELLKDGELERALEQSLNLIQLSSSLQMNVQETSATPT